MTLGFGNLDRVQRLRAELTRWSLYQVTVDLYNVMFWFENGHALANVAYRFDTQSPAGLKYIYDVQSQGGRKGLNVDFLLRKRVESVDATTDTELKITFEGGGSLTIHDSPVMRSAWFIRYDGLDHNAPAEWSEDDDELDGR